PEPSSVRLVVFDLNGRVVRTLVDQPMQAGMHSVVWDGQDALGRDAASGVYLYTVTTSRGASTKRMVLVR
ncbi:MAG TPA: FlgD immunoglobulin-like domain containing protein, partial [Candidatus Latescibacteria bacterium]|nr:FlgD immunoglobulin-like domain containing protein [Candidatus Latescibacterota bacterium]